MKTKKCKMKYLILLFFALSIFFLCSCLQNKEYTETSTKESITAVENTSINTNNNGFFTVSFVDYDGSILKIESVKAGKSANPPESPQRLGYFFVGWDTDYKEVKNDLTIIAKYEAKEYVVTFLDYDNSILKVENVKYGAIPSAPTIPTHDGRTFVSWDKPISSITSNLEIKAVYSLNKYVVTFKDIDGTILKTDIVQYGFSATAPEVYNKDGMSFIGWDRDFLFITSDIEITAKYDTDKCIVTFRDHNGKILKIEAVGAGGIASPPSNPIREGYEFIGWDKPLNNITSDIDVYASFRISKYLVVFKDYNGNELGSSIVNYGSNAIEPKTPQREGYIFVGWDKSFYKVTSDLIIYAIYKEKSTSTPTITVSNVYAKRGSEVEVTVNITNNPGISGARICIEVGDKLNLKNSLNGDAFSLLDFTSANIQRKPYYFSWDSLDIQSNENGIILKMIFDVSFDALSGEKIDIICSYRSGDIFDTNLNDVYVLIVNGAITIE